MKRTLPFDSRQGVFFYFEKDRVESPKNFGADHHLSTSPFR